MVVNHERVFLQVVCRRRAHERARHTNEKRTTKKRIEQLAGQRFDRQHPGPFGTHPARLTRSPGFDRRRARQQRFGRLFLSGTTRDAPESAHGVEVRLNAIFIFMNDLRHAVRTLVATPVVTIAAVLSLALGIGANTAIFSLINSLVLRTLPVPNPEQLTILTEEGQDSSWSGPMWQQLREHQHLVDGAFAWFPTRLTLIRGSESHAIDAVLASGGFFQVLRTGAMLGRTFTDADDRRDGVLMVQWPLSVTNSGDVIWWRERRHWPATRARSRRIHGDRRDAAGVFRAGRRSLPRRRSAAPHVGATARPKEFSRGAQFADRARDGASEAGAGPRRRRGGAQQNPATNSSVDASTKHERTATGQIPYAAIYTQAKRNGRFARARRISAAAVRPPVGRESRTWTGWAAGRSKLPRICSARYGKRFD